jgi:hypothetical protein
MEFHSSIVFQHIAVIRLALSLMFHENYQTKNMTVATAVAVTATHFESNMA